MEEIVALRELFDSVPTHEVSEADLAPDDSIVSHDVPVSHDFDLVEFLLAQTLQD